MPTPKKTKAEKIESGSYRPNKHGDRIDPPQGVYGRPDMPEGLTPSQQKVFGNVCDLLEQAEWLRISDGPTVHAFSILQDRLNKIPDEFTAAEFTQFRMLANELGMSPAARAKMPVKDKAKEVNEFDDIDN